MHSLRYRSPRLWSNLPQSAWILVYSRSQGYIKSSENCKTEIEGIFAAGDIREKNLRQLVTATSDGAIAATEAVNFINDIHS